MRLYIYIFTMFFPITFYIGLRYMRAKQRNHFISFMTATSIIGMALGITVLITVLSVMNGFDQVIREKIFTMAHQITVTDVRPYHEQERWQNLRHILLQHPHVIGAAPFTLGQALLLHQQAQRPIAVYGILPAIENTVSPLSAQIIQGSFELQEGQYQILLGKQLAMEWGVTVGDRVNLLVPTVAATATSLMPKFKAFQIAGIFAAGQGFNFDSYTVYIHIKDAQTLYQLSQGITGLRLKTDDLYEAPQISKHLATRLSRHYVVNNWTEHYGNLIYAIALEKTMTFCILLLLIAISAFNLVSSLAMVVTEKQSDIAILRSIGATTGTIVRIFIAQGALIGLLGTILGTVAGLFLATNIAVLVSFIETTLHIQLFNLDAYFSLEQLPSKIELSDIIQVASAALTMSFLATLYPARRAALIAPAEALRYE